MRDMRYLAHSKIDARQRSARRALTVWNRFLTVLTDQETYYKRLGNMEPGIRADDLENEDMSPPSRSSTLEKANDSNGGPRGFRPLLDSFRFAFAPPP